MRMKENEIKWYPGKREGMTIEKKLRKVKL